MKSGRNKTHTHTHTGAEGESNDVYFYQNHRANCVTKEI